MHIILTFLALLFYTCILHAPRPNWPRNHLKAKVTMTCNQSIKQFRTWSLRRLQQEPSDLVLHCFQIIYAARKPLPNSEVCGVTDSGLKSYPCTQCVSHMRHCDLISVVIRYIVMITLTLLTLYTCLTYSDECFKQHRPRILLWALWPGPFKQCVWNITVDLLNTENTTNHRFIEQKILILYQKELIACSL